jgi:hypothetical protein
MTEILFVAEEAIEGSYIARAVGSSIVTEADNIEGCVMPYAMPFVATLKRPTGPKSFACTLCTTKSSPLSA